ENYPVLLSDLPVPQLLTYPVYTTIAEKLHAICLFGMTNSRIKDYLDLLILIQTQDLDREILAQAVKSTFTRRNFPIPEKLPIGLTDEFSSEKTKQLQWQAFSTKNQITLTPLEEAIAVISDFIAPIFKKARNLS
ncbi:MAG: nucleotidyl transferase AbiEii/AbiGii toxin family protein, partial [Gammaproteobacteria bacterium]|nr:nucleotidyl transferase AbiEii/AbiGii toxin family protein [Gammaproteobacteria bacterium]